jgi:hypothetical protein
MPDDTDRNVPPPYSPYPPLTADGQPKPLDSDTLDYLCQVGLLTTTQRTDLLALYPRIVLTMERKPDDHV